MSIRMKNSPILVENLMDKISSVIACGGNHSMVVTEDGDLYGWGQAKYGAVGTGTTSNDISTPSFIRI